MHSSTAQPVQDQYYRIKMCPFYVRSRCTKGDKCTYAHNREEMRLGVSLKKTKICQVWRQGLCTERNCNFAHGEDELRSTADYYKTRLCKYWTSKVECPAGELCRHAHGQEQLRQRNYRLSNWAKREKLLINTNSKRKNFERVPGYEEGSSTASHSDKRDYEQDFTPSTTPQSVYQDFGNLLIAQVAASLFTDCESLGGTSESLPNRVKDAWQDLDSVWDQDHENCDNAYRNIIHNILTTGFDLDGLA